MNTKKLQVTNAMFHDISRESLIISQLIVTATDAKALNIQFSSKGIKKLNTIDVH